MRGSRARRGSAGAASILAAVVAQSTVTVTIAQGVGGAESAVLQEVIVTAQKRSQSLEDVPMTIAALGEDFFKDTGIGGLQELQMSVPGLGVATSVHPFTAAIRLRGVGSQGNEPSIEPSVGFFVDGVYQSRSGLGLADLADLDRVEILYGPQSTLYGKNTNAGAINVVTKMPSRTFGAEAELTLGDYALRDARVGLTGPIGDSIAWRLSARVNEQDGYLDDLDVTGGGGNESLNDADDRMVRGQLLFTPTDTLDIRLIGTYVDRDQHCCSGVLVPGPVHQMLYEAFGLPLLDPDDRRVAIDFPYTFEQTSRSASATVNWRLGAVTLTSITAWEKYDWDHQQDTDHSPLDFWRVVDKQGGDSVSQEVRITSNGSGPLQYVAGLYYYDAELRRGNGQRPGFVTFGTIPSLLPLPPPLTAAEFDTGVYDSVWNQQTIAGFGQVSYDLTDRANVTAGLRIDREKKDARLRIISLTASPTSLMALAILPPLDEQLEREDSTPTWMISGRYAFTPDVNGFATVSTGTKAGGFNGAAGPRSGDEREFEEEESINYEVGVKATLFGRRMRLNVAAFYTQVDDFQNLSFDATTGSFYVINAGEQSSRGVDLDSELVVNEHFSLNLSAEWLKAEYDAFPDGPCYFGRGGANAQGFCDLSGSELPWAPEFSGTLAGTFTYPLGNSELYLRGEVGYASKHIASDELDPAAETEYTVLNARLGLRRGPWDFALWGKNLGDETYIVQQVGVPLFDGSYMRWVNPPRTFGVTARYEF
ncbi:TonB-dependent receptor [Steroidobacter sp.]|uniref:TonB-dependent receptor n=1 Tax=Steroidobacter sp. TaxID=1978227 RepID=UPI002ED952BE